MPAGSPFKSVADVDRAGARIAVRRGAAYDLWLTRNIKHATVLRSDSADGPLDQFITEKLEALASLRQGLLQDVKKVPGGKNPSRQLHDHPAGDRHG